MILFSSFLGLARAADSFFAVRGQEHKPRIALTLRLPIKEGAQRNRDNVISLVFVPETLDRETALEKAKTVARAARDGTESG